MKLIEHPSKYDKYRRPKITKKLCLEINKKCKNLRDLKSKFQDITIKRYKAACRKYGLTALQSYKETQKFEPTNLGEFTKMVKRHGKTYASRYYKVTLAKITGYCRRHNIDVPKYKGLTTKHDHSITKVEIQEAIDKSTHVGEVLKRTSLNYSVLQRLAKKYDLSLPKNQWQLWEDDRKEIVDQLDKWVHLNYVEGLTLKEIAKTHSVSVGRLAAAFNDNDVQIKLHGKRVSSGENEVYDFICNYIDKNDVIKNSKSILPSKKELDIYIPKLNFAVEYCGEYWHSEERKEQSYHLDKYLECQTLGITLYTLFESEWLQRRNIVESMIKNRLNHVISVGARKTKFVEIPSYCAKSFHQSNHINGYVNSSYNVGLELDGELVSCLSFSRSRFDKAFDYEITRFSSKLGYRIVGGLSKMLSNANISGSLLTYADLRYGSGNGYTATGFTDMTKRITPNYWYFNKETQTKESRMAYTKKKILSKIEDPDSHSYLTESQLMQKFFPKVLKIYDCGSKKYSLKL